MNKLAVKELLKSKDEESSGSLPVEAFFECLADLGAPLEEEHKTKLLAIYDKKGEGSLSYRDLLDEHKYIHAVSTIFMLVNTYMCTCMYAHVHVHLCLP